MAEPAPVTSLDERRPRVRVEPPSPVASTVRKVGQAQAIVRRFRGGDFKAAALLVEDALASASVRAAVETRLAGLISTNIRWEPARENRDGRRARDAIEKDWPFILSQSTRRQRHQWGLLLGVGPGQKHWYQSRTTGRAIPRVQLYHPYFFGWNPTERAYFVQAQGEGLVSVPSPALGSPDEAGVTSWVIHEPWGKESYRSGYVVSVWDAWLRVVWACRDMARGSEKNALGAYTVHYPHGVDKNALADMLDALAKVNSEGSVPCEDFGVDGKFEVKPLEFTAANTFQLSRATKEVADTDIARLLLGMTSVTKDGNYGAATARELVRDDLKLFDAAAEMTTDRPQVVMPWAEANFGDPDLAPVAIYETDPPSVNQAAAQSLSTLGQALVSLVKVAPWVDVEALLARFRVPQLAREKMKAAIVEAQGAAVGAPPSPGGPPDPEAALARLAGELEPLARSNPGAAHRALGSVIAMLATRTT